MKFHLGRCLLPQRLSIASMTVDELARVLQYKPERLTDYIDSKRVMPLQVAISIADTLGCEVKDLYELIPASHEA